MTSRLPRQEMRDIFADFHEHENASRWLRRTANGYRPIVRE